MRTISSHGNVYLLPTIPHRLKWIPVVETLLILAISSSSWNAVGFLSLMRRWLRIPRRWVRSEASPEDRCKISLSSSASLWRKWEGSGWKPGRMERSEEPVQWLTENLSFIFFLFGCFFLLFWVFTFSKCVFVYVTKMLFSNKFHVCEIVVLKFQSICFQ